MLTGIVVGHTRKLLDYVQQAALEFREFSLYKSLDFSLPVYSIVRTIGSYGPDIVLIEVGGEDSEKAIEIAAALAELQQPIPVVALAENTDSRKPALDAGIEEILTLPFDGKDLSESVHRSLSRNKQTPGCPVICFQPAKGGSGASLTAMNVAACLANNLEKKVLLIELDMQSSSFHILMNLGFGTSVLEVAERAHQLRDLDWSRVASNVDGIDVLAAGGTRSFEPLVPWSLDRLLNFVRTRYDYVLIDLPESPGELTETIMQHAKATYVVTTLEVLYLQMSVCRIRQLEDRRAKQSSVHLILNQVPEELTGSLAKESAAVVGRPVAAVLPDEDQIVQLAITRKERIAGDNALGRAYLKFAGAIAGVEIADLQPEADDAKPRGLFGLFHKVRTA